MSNKKTNKNTDKNSNKDKNSIVRIIIIAVAVVLIAVIAIVTITKDNPKKYVDEDGVEHLLYIDEEGNTVLTDSGNIVVYATNTDGDIVEDENGEPMTASIAFPKIVIKGNTLETPDYKLSLSEEWILNENGVFTRKENENIKIKVLKMYELDTKSLSECFQDELKKSQAVVEMGEETYPFSEINTNEYVVTMKNLKAYGIECKLSKEENGTVDYYSNTMYLSLNDYVYQICIVYENGSYDGSIDFENIVDSNFTIKNIK